MLKIVFSFFSFRIYALYKAWEAYKYHVHNPMGRLEMVKSFARRAGKKVQYDYLIFDEGRGFIPLNLKVK